MGVCKSTVCYLGTAHVLIWILFMNIWLEHPCVYYRGMLRLYACLCAVLVMANALVSMDWTVCVCMCVLERERDCLFAYECSTLLQAEQRSPKGAQIPGISETSLASAVTMAKAAGGTPLFESVLYKWAGLLHLSAPGANASISLAQLMSSLKNGGDIMVNMGF